MQKGIMERDYYNSHEERDQTTLFCLENVLRDQNAPFRVSQNAQDLIAKISKMRGANCDSRKIGITESSSPMRCSVFGGEEDLR